MLPIENENVSIVFVGIMKDFTFISKLSNIKLKIFIKKYLTYSYFVIINLQYICGLIW